MNVVRYNFKDTNYTASVFVEDNGNLSDLIANVIKNNVAITGDFHQSLLETGTWAYWYAVPQDNKLTEITNSEVRDKLMPLESLVINGQ